jgi:hypothetical protein
MPYTHFECVLCCEDRCEELPRWIGDSQSARFCDACARDYVAPRFHAALQNEYQYPPMWGKEKLDIWTFWDLFDNDFREAWREKEKEYAMPVKRRLYCEHRDSASGMVCGEFLGQRGFGLELCERCQCYTCGDCGTTNEGAVGMRDHACEKAPADDAFTGLRKGRHYQKCPGCEKEIFLAEGCNHMTCRPPCGTHFCFVCGERVAAHQSGHWQRGGCPRFGVSGPRRIWDHSGEHSEDEGDESDGDDDERDLLELEQDTGRVNWLVYTFAGALAFERHRRMFGAVATVGSDRRIAFYSDLLANLDIVRQMAQNSLDVNQIPQQLREFNARHARIRNTYESSRNDPNWHTSSVTRLADLGDEFDAYFVFALERIADMNGIAEASERRTS